MTTHHLEDASVPDDSPARRESGARPGPKRRGMQAPNVRVSARPAPRPRESTSPGEAALRAPDDAASQTTLPDVDVEVSDAPATGEQADDTAPALPASWRSSIAKRRFQIVLAALVLLALMVTDVVLFVRRQHRDHLAESNQRAASLRSQAAGAAPAEVSAMLSYSYKTLAGDLAKARGATTGSFKTEFSQLVNTVIAPTARAKKITTKAQVVATAPINSVDSAVSVLVFIDQTTTSTQSATPRIDGSRAVVTLKKVGKRWLIVKLTPV